MPLAERYYRFFMVAARYKVNEEEDDHERRHRFPVVILDIFWRRRQLPWYGEESVVKLLLVGCMEGMLPLHETHDADVIADLRKDAAKRFPTTEAENVPGQTRPPIMSLAELHYRFCMIVAGHRVNDGESDDQRRENLCNAVVDIISESTLVPPEIQESVARFLVVGFAEGTLSPRKGDDVGVLMECARTGRLEDAKLALAIQVTKASLSSPEPLMVSVAKSSLPRSVLGYRYRHEKFIVEMWAEFSGMLDAGPDAPLLKPMVRLLVEYHIKKPQVWPTKFEGLWWKMNNPPHLFDVHDKEGLTTALALVVAARMGSELYASVQLPEHVVDAVFNAVVCAEEPVALRVASFRALEQEARQSREFAWRVFLHPSLVDAAVAAAGAPFSDTHEWVALGVAAVRLLDVMFAYGNDGGGGQFDELLEQRVDVFDAVVCFVETFSSMSSSSSSSAGERKPDTIQPSPPPYRGGHGFYEDDEPDDEADE